MDCRKKKNQHRPYSCEHWCHFTETLSDRVNFTDSLLTSHNFISSCNYVYFPHYPLKKNSKRHKQTKPHQNKNKKTKTEKTKNIQTNTNLLPHKQKTPNHFGSVFLILLTCHTWPRPREDKQSPCWTLLCLPKRNCSLALPNPLITLCKPFTFVSTWHSADTQQYKREWIESSVSQRGHKQIVNHFLAMDGCCAISSSQF